MEAIYIGIDLHKKFFVYHATDDKGKEISKGKFDSTYEALDQFLDLFSCSPKVVVEASGFSPWMTKSFIQKNINVTLAHPLKVKAIASAKIKTDKIDAKTLCHLLRADLVPSAYIASMDEQDQRELSRARIDLVHDQTQIKNRIHALLTKENLKFRGTDMFGTKGRLWIKEQLFGYIISEPKKQVLEIYLKRLDEVATALADVDNLIKQKSSSIPEVKLLQSIPSIGPTTAFCLVSEIGDIKRFHSAKAFTSYLGLVPRISQSGNHAYYGRITKLGNPYIRWVLVQSAQRLVRWNPEYKDYLEKLSARIGKKKAMVALSRKLATIVYAVLRDKRAYQEEYTIDYKLKSKVCPDVPTEELD